MMRLLRAHVQNFKLLEDVQLEFSTERDRPLTVIRAENGSGKTSLLYAFQWAFHGMVGLPDSARNLRLTSTATPAGNATTVSVTIEFEIADEHGNTARYRLIRSAIETPTAEDNVNRQSEKIRLLRLTPRGDERVEAAEAMINAWLPEQLHDVFFTDGDSVQTFISGQIGPRQRQSRVHDAIRALLGIDKFRIAAGDIESAFRSLQAEAAKSGGKDTSALVRQLEKTHSQIDELEAALRKLRHRQANMAAQRATWEKELLGLSGGDIEELNSRIEQAEIDQERLERQRFATLGRMRDALKSEQFSWQFMGDKLHDGVAVLSDLADRRVIPGASVGVLADRLEIGECICGESLAAGTDHRKCVEDLLEEQRYVSEKRQRLTELSHPREASRSRRAEPKGIRSDICPNFISIAAGVHGRSRQPRCQGIGVE